MIYTSVYFLNINLVLYCQILSELQKVDKELIIKIRNQNKGYLLFTIV